jgi:hypothetical protein
MKMRRLAAVLAFACTAAASAAETVTLKSAWMRPAPAGTAQARAYVDIASTASVKLVGAATPVAARVQLVRVKQIDDPSSEVVVASMDVAAGVPTRLAYRGDHLRLTGIKRDLANGDPVPLTLTFRDEAGKRFEVTTNILVRGLLLPQQIPAPSRDAATAPPAPIPGAPAPMTDGKAPARM